MVGVVLIRVAGFGRQELRDEGVVVLIGAGRPERSPAQVRDEGDAGRQSAAVVLGCRRVCIVRLRQFTVTNSHTVRLNN